MERAERQSHLPIAQQVRIGERHRQLVVLIPNGRTEEERPAPFEIQDQAGEIARALVIQPFLPQSTRLDIAVVVEDRKGVAVLEHAGALVGQARGSQDVIQASLNRRLWRSCVRYRHPSCPVIAVLCSLMASVLVSLSSIMQESVWLVSGRPSRIPGTTPSRGA